MFAHIKTQPLFFLAAKPQTHRLSQINSLRPPPAISFSKPKTSKRNPSRNHHYISPSLLPVSGPFPMVHNNGRGYQLHKNTADAGERRGESEIGMRSVRFRPSSPEMIRKRPDPKPLHNFALPLLGWGCQRVMQSVKEFGCPTSPLSSSMISESGHRSSVPLPCHQARFAEEEDGEGIGAVRVKLMSDLRMETDRFQKELLKCDDVTEAEEEPFGKLARAAVTAGRREGEEAAETRPWNLRPRRAASNCSPEKENKREKFSVALKRKEIEDDFMRLTGRRPPQRPKKGRNGAVQKKLDMVFPGFFLTEVTADMYKVVDVPDKVKR